MTLKEEIFRIKIQFIDILCAITDKIASWFFGYPNVPGMEIKPRTTEQIMFSNHVRGLPVHQTRCPPPAAPSTLSEVLFGNVPEFQKIPRIFYQHKQDGFYNIQIPDYKNIWFLHTPLVRGW